MVFLVRGSGLRASGAAALAITITTVVPSVPARQANPGDFQDAAESSVRFTLAPHRAIAACTSLGASIEKGENVQAVLIPAVDNLPEHCRIRGTIPAEIGFEVNLPTQWNGRLWMFGNGGYAGESADSPAEAGSRANGLSNGFATVRTDTGHLAAKEPLATFGYKQPDKIIDHGYRAVHETVLAAKRLIAGYYGRAQDYAYWSGCSTGGRQGMMSAARYPEDFDGILAAAPTLRWSDIMMKGVSNQLALDSAPGLTQAKLAQVHKAVVEKCDVGDGVSDGLLADPRACRFDPNKHLPLCPAGSESQSCFSPAEVDAITRLRKGPSIKGRRTLPQYYDVFHPTTSERWITNADKSPNGLTVYSESYMKYFAFEEQDPRYDWKSVDFATDPDRMRWIDAILNPPADLDAFSRRKGKLLTYWGWSDAALNPKMGIDYYDEVSARMGLKHTQSFYRLFLIPGVGHCGGGYGPDRIDAMTPLIDWVESGKEPARLVATKVTDGVVKYRRAYCPYPQATRYTGGDTESVASYSCSGPAAR